MCRHDRAHAHAHAHATAAFLAPACTCKVTCLRLVVSVFVGRSGAVSRSRTPEKKGPRRTRPLRSPSLLDPARTKTKPEIQLTTPFPPYHATTPPPQPSSRSASPSTAGCAPLPRLGLWRPRRLAQGGDGLAAGGGGQGGGGGGQGARAPHLLPVSRGWAYGGRDGSRKDGGLAAAERRTRRRLWRARSQDTACPPDVAWLGVRRRRLGRRGRKEITAEGTLEGVGRVPDVRGSRWWRPEGKEPEHRMLLPVSRGWAYGGRDGSRKEEVDSQQQEENKAAAVEGKEPEHRMLPPSRVAGRYGGRDGSRKDEVDSQEGREGGGPCGQGGQARQLDRVFFWGQFRGR